MIAEILKCEGRCCVFDECAGQVRKFEVSGSVRKWPDASYCEKGRDATIAMGYGLKEKEKTK